MKSSINKIVKLFFRIFLEPISDKAESLAIAGIHTTLISLFIAGFLAYLAFVYNAVQNAELKAIEEANKINNVKFLVHYCPYKDFGYRETGLEKVFNREVLIEIIKNAIINPDAAVLPKDPTKRAQKVLGAMSALTEQYPFPAFIFKTREGRFGFRSEPDEVFFANIDDLRKWVSAIDNVTGVFFLEGIGGRTSLKDLFEELGRSDFAAHMRMIIEKPPLIQPKIDDGTFWFIKSEALDPIANYNDYLVKITETRIIMKSAKHYIRQSDVLRERYPNKLALTVISFSIIVAFVLGVLVPLSFTTVRRILILWMPIFIYAMIALYLWYKIVL